MRTYRRFIIGTKKRNGTARGLMYYRRFIHSYLEAKRQFFSTPV